ncbi:MAG: FadR family transcriptional regulator [Syntrophomonadaceae bacterium]|mgnify:CR=1 FL=1|nr:FadR family transcriptional regulator [Syntrophomonadaceae bacterium]
MPEFTPIKTRKVYEEIIDQLRELISTGTYSPGDKLPSERDMAQMLGVSRASVREAVVVLQAMGFLVVRAGEGTFVSKSINNETIEPLAAILSMERNPLAQLMEVRRILEVEAAALAAERATEQDRLKMVEVLNDMKAVADRSQQGVEFDLYFHFAIADAAHNPLLRRIIKTLDNMMHQTFLVNRNEMYSDPKTADRILGEHQIILDAILNCDSAAAREGMLKHLEHVERGLTT